MSKLLVNTPSSRQEIIEVGPGGRYFDAYRVLWDERFDGPLPQITLGGMVRLGGDLVTDSGSGIQHRVGGELVFSQPRMDEHTASLRPPVPQSITRRQALQQLRIEGITEDQIVTKINALEVSQLQKDLALIEFKESQVFERARPLVTIIGMMLGKDSLALDAMFIAAHGL